MSTLKKPLSDAKLKANRANAAKSTGPRTGAGKRRSALNAVTHGLTASLSAGGITPRDITALGEDRSLLPATVQRFMNSWNPATPYEASLVKRLAELEVRLGRCIRMETGLLDSDLPEVTASHSHESISSALANAFASHESTFMNYSRYESNLSRAYERTLKQLLAVRKEKLAPSPEDLPGSSRMGRVETAGGGDQTNPPYVENKQPPPDPEATEPDRRPIAQLQAHRAQDALCDVREDRRFEFDSPVTPIDAQNRRHGAFVPPPEPELPPVKLVWIYGGKETVVS